MYTYSFKNKFHQLGLITYTLCLFHESDFSLNINKTVIIREDQDNIEYLNSIAKAAINHQIHLNSLSQSAAVRDITSADVLEESTDLNNSSENTASLTVDIVEDITDLL